jgi:hypothetical protein
MFADDEPLAVPYERRFKPKPEGRNSRLVAGVRPHESIVTTLIMVCDIVDVFEDILSNLSRVCLIEEQYRG